MRLRHAFTLIELLVVLAIITILAALIFPVFARAREGVRQTTCASNFKQQAVAVLLYQQDYDEMIPNLYYGDGTWNSPPSTVFAQVAYGYLGKNRDILRCPSDPASPSQLETDYMLPVNSETQRQFNLGMKNHFGFNYQYLCPVGARDDGTYFSIPISIAAIGSQANTILAADSTCCRDEDGTMHGGGMISVDPPCRNYSNGTDSFAPDSFAQRWDWGGWNPSHPEYNDVYGCVWPWHNQFVIVAFCDGHIKSKSIGQLQAGCHVQDLSSGVIYDKEAYLWDLQ